MPEVRADDYGVQWVVSVSYHSAERGRGTTQCRREGSPGAMRPSGRQHSARLPQVP